VLRVEHGLFTPLRARERREHRDRVVVLRPALRVGEDLFSLGDDLEEEDASDWSFDDVADERPIERRRKRIAVSMIRQRNGIHHEARAAP
jgi:hypothetical protein